MGLLPSKKVKVVVIIDLEKMQAALNRQYGAGAPKVTREVIETQVKEQWTRESEGIGDIGLSIEVTEGRW